MHSCQLDLVGMGGVGRCSEAKVQPLDKGKDGASTDKGLSVAWAGREGGRGSTGSFEELCPACTQGCREHWGSLGMLKVGRDPLKAR